MGAAAEGAEGRQGRSARRTARTQAETCRSARSHYIRLRSSNHFINALDNSVLADSQLLTPYLEYTPQTGTMIYDVNSAAFRSFLGAGGASRKQTKVHDQTVKEPKVKSSENKPAFSD
eukprot:jgi/Mesvir1/18823/Mv09268-RA.1